LQGGPVAPCLTGTWILSQLICSFCKGGNSLADAEKLKNDPLAERLAGMAT